MTHIAAQIGERLRRRISPEAAPAQHEPQTPQQEGKRRADIIRATEELGIFTVGLDSKDEEIAEFERRLWEDQDDVVEARAREWRQHLLYEAGEQRITWHRGAGRWVRRAGAAWRVDTRHNIIAQAVRMRVARLTENKPMITVQAATPEREDIMRAELKEQHFWYLWHELKLHARVTEARRWATRCGSGFFKAGWDADGGRECPVIRMMERSHIEQQPVTDPATGLPTGEMQDVPVLDGWEEVYVDAAGNELGPVDKLVPQQDRPGAMRWQRQDPPEGAATYNEGVPFVDVRSPFNVRWDTGTDDPADSWWIQDAEVLPASRIVALIPKAAELLGKAEAATSEHEELRWEGLRERIADPFRAGRSNRHRDTTALEKEYVVRETWIFPKNGAVRAKWGKKGALIITVGGVLVHKRPLPKWALDACPFVRLFDEPEPANHYAKTFLRDVIPLQDDVNTARATWIEGAQLRDRIMLGVPKGEAIEVETLPDMPVAVIRYGRDGAAAPTAINLGQGSGETGAIYESSLSAARDMANMNDASRGEMPNAGTPAKAIYALQYASERSVTETSAAQDMALQALARSLDAITRYEYREDRMLQIPGEDREYMVEVEYKRDAASSRVDYQFTPGSMLSLSREAIKNEIATALELGIMEPWQAKKLMPTSIPGALSSSYDANEAHANRQVAKALRGEPMDPPQPYHDPHIHAQVYGEFLLSVRSERLPPPQRAAVIAAYQQYQQMAQPQPAQPQQQGGAPAPQAQPQPAPPPTPGGSDPAAGAAALEAQATQAMQGPEAAVNPT